MIDSRMNLYVSHLEEHRNGASGDEAWTAYHRTLESDVYAGPDETPAWADPIRPDPEELPGPGLEPDDDSPDEDAEGDDSETMDLFGQ